MKGQANGFHLAKPKKWWPKLLAFEQSDFLIMCVASVNKLSCLENFYIA